MLPTRLFPYASAADIELGLNIYLIQIAVKLEWLDWYHIASSYGRTPVYGAYDGADF
jgi:hypothetical protein